MAVHRQFEWGITYDSNQGNMEATAQDLNSDPDLVVKDQITKACNNVIPAIANAVCLATCKKVKTDVSEKQNYLQSPS